MQESKATKFQNTDTILLNVHFCTPYTNMPLQYGVYVTTTSMLPTNRNTVSDLNIFDYLFPIYQSYRS